MQYGTGNTSGHCIDIEGDSVRLLQLTDTHLCAEPGGTLLGMDTDHSVQAVIELARTERPGSDVLLCTGDLSDNGSEAAYKRLQDYSGGLAAHSFWLPGNHDGRAEMERAVRSPEQLCRDIRAGQWQIVMLNTQVPGEVGGVLGKAELDLLEDLLIAGQAAGRYSLICMHHQPVVIGCAWLDQQMVADADDFFSVLDRFPAVRGVLWGHVHQHIDRWRKDVRLMATPSTCVQFAPSSDAFRVDDQPPGYRWLELADDGTIATGVSRVQHVTFNVELGSTGYL